MLDESMVTGESLTVSCRPRRRRRRGTVSTETARAPTMPSETKIRVGPASKADRGRRLVERRSASNQPLMRWAASGAVQSLLIVARSWLLRCRRGSYCHRPRHRSAARPSDSPLPSWRRSPRNAPRRARHQIVGAGKHAHGESAVLFDKTGTSTKGELVGTAAGTACRSNEN